MMTDSVWIRRLRSYKEFQAQQAEFGETWTEFRRREGEIAADFSGNSLSGYSVPAARQVDFSVAWPTTGGEPNWRETIVCPVTGLANRTRAAFHILNNEGLTPRHKIYLTEQATPVYTWFKEAGYDVTGSEFLDGVTPSETDARGLRCEDLTRLSFADATFDDLLTFDVFEHVPDFRAALSECARVIKPGGRMVLTAPFSVSLEHTLVRARIGDDGSIEHLLEPEYHGDPVREGGVLCYYYYGWNLLDDMRAAGFADAEVVLYWSEAYGYLGAIQVLVIARR